MQPELQYGAQSGALSGAQNKVLRNTYLLLALTLIPTAIGALVGTNMNWSLMQANRGISFILMLVVFYGWIFAIERNRNSGIGLGLLFGFTLFMGVMLGPVMQFALGFSNGGQLVMMAAVGTAAVFLGLAGIAASTKRDFSFLSKFIFAGFIVIMLAVVASAFIQAPALVVTILGAFILFSSAVILYQVNQIVRGGETNYISATLTLYVAIYNIFSSLLQLLGIFGGDRD
jgi:FtsH-binding integral membrane protein